MARCSICHTLIRPEEPVMLCPSCRQEYHASCWTELGGCATYACDKAAPPEKPAPVVTAGAGWGDWKTCPACGGTLGASLLRCPCGARFPHADPLTAAEYRAWTERERWIRGRRRAILWLFVVSLFGIPAPLTGAIAGGLAWSARERLAGADGTHLAIGYGAAALGVVHTLLVLALLGGM